MGCHVYWLSSKTIAFVTCKRNHLGQKFKHEITRVCCSPVLCCSGFAKSWQKNEKGVMGSHYCSKLEWAIVMMGGPKKNFCFSGKKHCIDIYQCNQAEGYWSCTSRRHFLHFPSSFPILPECTGRQRLVPEGMCISQESV